MAKIILDNKDLTELVRLTNEAKGIPVIAMSLKDGLEGRDFASQAWARVKVKWAELGKKYNFKPEDVKGIVTVTGEVLRR